MSALRYILKSAQETLDAFLRYRFLSFSTDMENEHHDLNF